MDLLKAVLASPQLTGIILTAVSAAIHGWFTKQAAPSGKLQTILQIAYVVVSGLATLLNMYLNGQLGTVTAAEIQNFLNVYMTVLATHFAAPKLFEAHVKPLLARFTN